MVFPLPHDRQTHGDCPHGEAHVKRKSRLDGERQSPRGLVAPWGGRNANGCLGGSLSRKQGSKQKALRKTRLKPTPKKTKSHLIILEAFTSTHLFEKQNHILVHWYLAFATFNKTSTTHHHPLSAPSHTDSFSADAAALPFAKASSSSRLAAEQRRVGGLDQKENPNPNGDHRHQ